MKRIFSLVCALMLLFCLAPASAAMYDVDFLLSQSAALHSLMLEKANVLSAFGSAAADTQSIKDALSGPVAYVRVLRFESDGAYARFASLSGEELPEMSDTLTASFDAMLPSTIITQLNNQYLSLSAASMLTTGSSAVVPGMTQDALVVLDFAADYQLACVFLTGNDGIVGCSAYPVATEADVLSAFCEFYALSQNDVTVYTGDILHQASATDALQSYAQQMKNVLTTIAPALAQPIAPVQPETLGMLRAFAELYPLCHLPARVRMLTLDEDTFAGYAEVTEHALLTSLVHTYNGLLGTAYATAGSLCSASEVFDMPRGMSPAIIVQADYKAADGSASSPVLSVVCVFTPAEDRILCTAVTAHYSDELNFLDALTSGSLDVYMNPNLVITLQP